MKDPQTVAEVVSTLRRNFDLPISVKHRLHSSIEESIQFAKACEMAGCSAVTLHGRVKEQKHTGSVAYDRMKLVFEHLSVAKIGNGRVKSREDARQMMAETGCDSIMISSAAIKNPSVFQEEPLNVMNVARRYIDLCEELSLVDRREWRWLLTNMLGKWRNISKTDDYVKLCGVKELSEAKRIVCEMNV
jgi:tRNA-dihydrouridine synthase